MNKADSALSPEQPSVRVKKTWKEPSIALERSLQTQADKTPPGSVPGVPSVLGPLSNSGGLGCN